MASLTEVSFYTRRMIVGVLIFFVLVLISPFVFGGIRMIVLAVFPPQPEAAEHKYGALPELLFPKPRDTYKPELSLEIIGGDLPDLPRVAKVYVVEANKARLLELDRIRARAKIIGFESEPREVDDRTFIFSDSKLPRELAVDLIYGSYGYKYKWQGDGAFLSAKSVPGRDEAQSLAKGFFSSLGLLENDLSSGRTTYAFLAAKIDGQMVPVGSLSEANFVRVDIFRNDIEKLKVVHTDWSTASVNVIFSGQTDTTKRIVGANYNYSKIVENNFSTYVLKSTNEAWQELATGGGYVAQRGGDKLKIRRAYLAYFESNQPQPFFQPVFVFEGDGGFVGYVSAVDPKNPDRPSKN